MLSYTAILLAAAMLPCLVLTISLLGPQYVHHLRILSSSAVPLAGDHKRAEIQAVQTAEDLWKAIGRDSWIVVPIDSTARPGGQGGSSGWSCRASGAARAPACIALHYRRPAGSAPKGWYASLCSVLSTPLE